RPHEKPHRPATHAELGNRQQSLRDPQGRESELTAMASPSSFVIGHSSFQNSAFPGVRANGITSRMFETPVRNINNRSKPSPNPACGTVPKRRRSVYHQ